MCNSSAAYPAKSKLLSAQICLPGTCSHEIIARLYAPKYLCDPFQENSISVHFYNSSDPCLNCYKRITGLPLCYTKVLRAESNCVILNPGTWDLHMIKNKRIFVWQYG